MSSQQNSNTASGKEQPASLESELASPVLDPNTPRAAADAKRAMTATDAWKPVLDRKQSWSNQEYKHEMQMGDLDDVKAGPGFTERK